MDVKRDEAAVFTFDTRLDEVEPFTMGLKALPESFDDRGAVRRDLAARRHRGDGDSASASAKAAGARWSC